MSRISKVRIELLRLLICVEPTILAKVQSWDGSTKVTPNAVSVREDGQVFFYYGKGPLWWQRLLNTYESVSLLDVAIRIADAITGSGGTRNDVVFDGITQALLKEAIKNKDLDCVVDILFDSMRNASSGELHSKYINKEAIEKFTKEKGLTGKLVVSDNIFGFAGIEIRPGVVVPVRLGKVKQVQYLNWNIIIKQHIFTG